MSAVLWVHWDALSNAHPVASAATEGARAVFIWDADEVARRDWSLKRCVFILECLDDMNVEILEGRPSEILNGLAPSQVFTAKSPDPYIHRQIAEIDADVSVVGPDPFAVLSETADMKRFFRYWNKAKKSVMQPTDAQASS